MSNVSSAEMRIRLKAEIDRMSDLQLQNTAQSQNSFFSWVRSTVQIIWNIIIDYTIETMFINVANWLWACFFI